MDVLTQRGWFNYLDHLLQLRDNALVVAGPPCSLYVWISRGTHSRLSHGHDIYGNTKYLSIRMSNAIVRNFVWLLKKIHLIRPLFWIIEQPTSSQMFLVPEMDEALQMWGLWLTTTWMGCFGHVLWKGTKLMNNIPNSSRLKRKLTMQQKKAIALRKRKMNKRAQAQGGSKKVYYRKSADGRVTGGKDLGSTATYPRQFAHQVFFVWKAAFQALKNP
ncbi:unnamed protein product [Cladocopium goreaui]|uniref:Uncharacterized protein n=1 Tax=Cladocopium goreaui TaxID=2562237 RepID=A0A9P1CDU2_9DINO|nr:unnamed protein product [Cladocopium goreaui]